MLLKKAATNKVERKVRMHPWCWPGDVGCEFTALSVQPEVEINVSAGVCMLRGQLTFTCVLWLLLLKGTRNRGTKINVVYI